MSTGLIHLEQRGITRLIEIERRHPSMPIMHRSDKIPVTIEQIDFAPFDRMLPYRHSLGHATRWNGIEIVQRIVRIVLIIGHVL